MKKILKVEESDEKTAPTKEESDDFSYEEAKRMLKLIKSFESLATKLK